jgi:epoxyqueuosine reductase
MAGGRDTCMIAASITPAVVKREAAAAGFDLCGIAPAADHVELRFLREWLDRGYAGDMHYLHASYERRTDVRRVLPAARSVISLGTVYNTARPYSSDCGDGDRAAVARYAWGDDYHTIIEHRLDGLLASLRAAAGEGFEARRYVDTGPVQERVYAQYAGLGWIGKNTCLINPELGSWVFLSESRCSISVEPARCAWQRARPARWSSPACSTRRAACRT